MDPRTMNPLIIYLDILFGSDCYHPRQKYVNAYYGGAYRSDQNPRVTPKNRYVPYVYTTYLVLVTLMPRSNT